MQPTQGQKQTKRVQCSIRKSGGFRGKQKNVARVSGLGLPPSAGKGGPQAGDMTCSNRGVTDIAARQQPRDHLRTWKAMLCIVRTVRGCSPFCLYS